MNKKLIDLTFASFKPREYLNEYYSHIGDENQSLLEFFWKAYKHIPKNARMLEFSGGPTIYPMISAVPFVKEIHFADFLEANRKEVKLWKQNSHSAFDWSPFIIRALQIEGYKNLTENDIKKRQTGLRKKITRFLHCNAFKPDPLGKKYRNTYDLVNVNFVPDSITSNKKIWGGVIFNICTLLKRNGLLIMSALKNATYWLAGDKYFPATDIDESDIKIIFKKLRFKIISLSSINAEVLDEKSELYEGYKGIMFIIAKKLDFTK